MFFCNKLIISLLFPVQTHITGFGCNDDAFLQSTEIKWDLILRADTAALVSISKFPPLLCLMELNNLSMVSLVSLRVRTNWNPEFNNLLTSSTVHRVLILRASYVCSVRKVSVSVSCQMSSHGIKSSWNQIRRASSTSVNGFLSSKRCLLCWYVLPMSWITHHRWKRDRK